MNLPRRLLAALAVAWRVSREAARWDNRLLRVLTTERLWSLSPVWRYGLAVAIGVAAPALRAALVPWLGTSTPHNFGLVAVVLTTVLLGIRPGLLCVVLTLVLGEAFVLGSVPANWDATTLVRLGVGMVIGVFVVSILHAARIAVGKTRQSEQWLRMQRERMPIGYLVHDENNCFTEINPAAERIFGYTAAELRGRHVNVIVPEASRPHVDGILRRVAEGDLTAHSENENVTKDGRTIICQWTNTPLRDATGKFIGFLSMVQDITDRKRAEEERERLTTAVYQERDRLSALINSITDEIWFADADKTFTLANPAALKEFGAAIGNTKEVEKIASSVEVYRPDGTPRPVNEAPPLRALRGETVAGQEEIVRMPGSGQLRHRQVNAAPVRSPDGSIIGSVSVVRDITRRKQAEEVLRTAMQRFYSALSGLYGGILLVTNEGKVEFANQSFCNLFDVTVSPQDLVGLAPDEILGMIASGYEEPEKAIHHIREIVSRGEPVQGEEVAKRNGRILLRDFIPINLDGKSYGRLWHHLDITERKRAEEALRLTQASVDGAAEMVAWFTADGRVYYANDATCRALGYSRDELLQLTAVDFSPGFTWEQYEEHWRDVRKRKSFILEVTHRRKDGSEYPAEVLVNHVVHGGREYMFAYGRDITERKRAESRLAANLAALTRMHALSERLLEPGGLPPLLQEVMDAAVAIVGAERGTLQLLEGDSLRIVAHHGHKRPFLDFFAAAENRASVCGEALQRGERVVVPDVETSPLFVGTPSLPVLREAGVRAVQSTPMVSRNGLLLGILTTQWGTPHTPDEHDLWRIDLLVRQAADMIERARAEEALKASLREKEVLLKEIHHRVKNNMQVISSLVGLQADRVQDAAMRSVLQDVGHRVRSMALVHEKLYQSPDMARVEFAEYARGLLGYLWRAHGTTASGIRLVTDLEPVPLSVNAAVPCGLILNELVSNALKHAFPGENLKYQASNSKQIQNGKSERAETEGCEVRVTLKAGPEGQVCLRVRDNGVGLPPGLDWRQADSLGLRIVQILAAQLHATVEVCSGEGTEFTILF